MSIFRSHMFQILLVIISGLFFRIVTRFFFVLFITGGYFVYSAESFSNPVVHFYFLSFPIFFILNFVIGLTISTINLFLEEEQGTPKYLIYLLIAGITIEGTYVSVEYVLLSTRFGFVDWNFLINLIPLFMIIAIFLLMGHLSARYLLIHYPNVSKYIFEMVFLIYSQVKDFFSSLRLFKLSISSDISKKKLINYLKELKPVIPILIVAIIVRFYNLTNIGFRYWDEGYYAIEAMQFIRGGKSFYKPGHVILIALAFVGLGYEDYVAILPSAILGSLTVFLAYEVGRKLFNKTTGFFAASILACDAYNILYSRSALADANLTFFVALTFYLYISGRYLANNSEQSNETKIAVNPVNIRTPTVFLSGLVASYTFAVKETAIIFIGFIVLFESLYLLKKQEERGYTILFLVLFTVGCILGYFFIHFPLYLLKRWSALPVVYETRLSIVSQIGRGVHIAQFIHLWNLSGIHVFFLMIVGLFTLLKDRKREGLFVTGWFIFMLIFWSSIPHIEPRNFAQAIFPYVLISGKGVEFGINLLVQNVTKRKILWKNTMSVTICILVLFSGFYLSMKTIQLESNAYKEVSELLNDEHSRGGFSTMPTIMQFYTSRNWEGLKENSEEKLIAAAQKGQRHIVIDYMYYHPSYNTVAEEILEKCTPIYIIYNNAASHRYTLLETFQSNITDVILKDPLAKYIYVYTVEDVVNTLYLQDAKQESTIASAW